MQLHETVKVDATASRFTAARSPRRSSASARRWWRDSSAAGPSGRARPGSQTPAPRSRRRTSPALRRPRRSPAASRSRSIRIMVRLRAPPPATIQLFGPFGSSGTIRAIAAAVNAVSVAAPSAGGIVAELQRGKIVAVERFRRRQREERKLQRPRDPGLVDAALRRNAALAIEAAGSWCGTCNRRAARCRARCRRRSACRSPSI